MSQNSDKISSMSSGSRFSRLLTKTARKVSKISARLRYLVDLVGRERDAVVTQDLPLYCAVKPVSGEVCGNRGGPSRYTLKEGRVRNRREEGGVSRRLVTK